MGYRIFTWATVSCVLDHLYACVYTWGLGHTNNESAQHFWVGKITFFLCSWRGSDNGSLDFESDALPTEPPRHRVNYVHSPRRRNQSTAFNPGFFTLDPKLPGFSLLHFAQDHYMFLGGAFHPVDIWFWTRTWCIAQQTWYTFCQDLYVFGGSLSSGRHMILNQDLVHRTADVIHIGYLPRSPRTILFGVFIPVFKNRLHANMCTFSMPPNWWVPHTSEPYIKTGSTWASNILENTFLWTFPSLRRLFDICAILAVALEASSPVIRVSESLVVKCRPRYLYLFTTPIVLAPYHHTSLAEIKPPFRNITILS